MKMSKGQPITLQESDFNTLYMKDPLTFFESILVNILWEKTAASIDHELIARQKLLFEKWFKYYENNLHYDMGKELELARTKAYRDGHLDGKIEALTHLPLTGSVFFKTVDTGAVASTIQQLKLIKENK